MNVAVMMIRHIDIDGLVPEILFAVNALQVAIVVPIGHADIGTDGVFQQFTRLFRHNFDILVLGIFTTEQERAVHAVAVDNLTPRLRISFELVLAEVVFVAFAILSRHDAVVGVGLAVVAICNQRVRVPNPLDGSIVHGAVQLLTGAPAVHIRAGRHEVIRVDADAHETLNHAVLHDLGKRNVKFLVLEKLAEELGNLHALLVDVGRIGLVEIALRHFVLREVVDAITTASFDNLVDGRGILRIRLVKVIDHRTHFIRIHRVFDGGADDELMTKGDIIVVLRFRPLAQKNVDCFVGSLFAVTDSNLAELAETFAVDLCHHFLDDIFILHVVVDAVILHLGLSAFDLWFLVAERKHRKRDGNVETDLEIAGVAVRANLLLTFGGNFVVDGHVNGVAGIHLPTHIIVGKKEQPLSPKKLLRIILIRVETVDDQNITVLNATKMRILFSRPTVLLRGYDLLNFCHCKRPPFYILFCLPMLL